MPTTEEYFPKDTISENIQPDNDNSINQTMTNDFCRKTIAALELYQKLLTLSQKPFIKIEINWKLLFFWVNITQRDFYTHIKQLYPKLKKRDLQICCLIKLGFNNAEIRCIFDIQQSTLYVDKAKTKKIFIENGCNNKRTLEEIINALK